MFFSAHQQSTQRGYIKMFLIFGLIIFIGFLLFPDKLPHVLFPPVERQAFCTPYLEDNGDIKPDAPTIMAPSYEYNDNGEHEPKINQDLRPYRLIKANVPIWKNVVLNYFSSNELHNQTPYTVKCPNPAAFANGEYHHHFCQWIHEAIYVNSPLTKADKYAVLYPPTYAQSTGNRSTYWSNGQPYTLLYADYQIIFLVHLHNNNTTYDIPGIWYNLDGTVFETPWSLIDVYQRVNESNPSKPINRVPDTVLKCSEPPTSQYVKYVESGLLGPHQNQDKKQLQWDWFLFQKFRAEFDWYFPACKPAVYLYPQQDTKVNVQVSIPHGQFLYTDPLYPSGGWNVLAHPDGSLQYLGNTLSDSKGKINYTNGVFPYLYYEARIQDKAVKKPTEGFIKKYEDLPTFYTSLLPKLGLSAKETKEFTDYWTKSLPKSPYYFIGIIPQDNLQTNETIALTPKEDTRIRVRLYFEPLDKPKTVIQPDIQTPVRNGFTMVDWGGIVKTDKNHPFTCLQ